MWFNNSMRSGRPLLFTVLGALFLIAGLVTLLGLIMSWNLSAPIRGEFIGYAALDFLLAYGFFNMQRWLVAALALNWLVGAFLAAIRVFGQPGPASPSTWYLMSFLVGGLVFYAVFRLPRKQLTSSKHARYAGSAFLLIWAVTACYTMVGLLS